MQSLGKRIRAHREKKGLTQPQLVQQAKIGQATLSDLENDKRKDPGINTVLSVCKVLEISPLWAIFGVGPERLPGDDWHIALTLYAELLPANRSAWIAAGAAMVGSQKPPEPPAEA